MEWEATLAVNDNYAFPSSIAPANQIRPARPDLKTRPPAARFHRAISQSAIAASFSLNPDLLRATGVCLHVDLFTSVRIDDLERGGGVIQTHRLHLSFGRQGVSDG